MLGVLKNVTYRRLFTAQVIALLGTGLATVALGLLALDLAGDRAGAVLGTALAIKMVAYVSLAPIAAAVAPRFDRRTFLVATTAIRGLVVLSFPFVTEVWQIYVLVLLLQASSAAFTPAFQATIPDIVPDEDEYLNALSLSRLAYDLEALLSPLLAAALLTVISFSWLFSLTSLGFALCALLVATTALPTLRAAETESGGWWSRTTRGARIYLATPRLRGLFGLNLSVAAAGAMVIVNTVVIVGDELNRSASDIALALAVYGGGSMVIAIVLPRLLRARQERFFLLIAGALLSAALAAGAALASGLDSDGVFVALLALWAILGAGSSLVLTPAGRLLRRSARPADLPAVFAAQFSLSHACWLLTYPIAGWVGAAAGMEAAFAVLAGLSLLGLMAAMTLWRQEGEGPISHVHTNLPPDHPHIADAQPVPGGWRHAHPYVIDSDHRQWPD